MGTELATQKETRLATPAPEFSNDQIRLLGETVAKGCDQNELAFFLHVAKLKRLDPFTGQIHVVKRWDSSLGKEKMTVQVGIDGFRVIASRTNDLAGIDDAVYDTDIEEHPNVATVTVYRYGRSDERIPYKATARWTEYAQTKKDGDLGPMWKKLPYLMLGKCAEALALRKAFPDELSGMYTNEEMDQAENEVPAQHGFKKPPVQQPTRASEKKQEPPPAGQQPPQGQKPSAQSQSIIAGEEELSGIIETVKEGKEGMIWLSLKNGVLTCVGEKHIDSDMKPGYFIKFRGVMQKRDKLSFFTFLGLRELSQVLDGTPEPDKPAADKSASLAPDASAVAEELFGSKEPAGKAAVQGLVDSGQVTTAASLPAAKAGSIGKGRAQRLYAIAGQNAKKTGFTEENIKKVLAALYPDRAEQHLSELEKGRYEWFEKLCTGEEPWADYLPE
jgi:phage recombination protein Bet